MATRSIDKNTLEEKLIWLAIVAFWPVYAIGGLYVMGAIVGWLILGLVVLRWYVEGATEFNRMPLISGLWIVAMLVMLLCVWIGHTNWSLGLAKTIKSSIGWMKGWALIALFIALGSVLKMRTQRLIRAVCITSTLAIGFFVLSFLVYLVGGPEVLFVSPLKIVGGPGPEYFEFRFFGMNPETGMPRWFFFAPWAPAAGLLSCLFLLICLQEKHVIWKTLGVMGCILICVCSQSRAGLAIMLVIVPVYMFLAHMRLSVAFILTGLLIPIVFLIGYPVIEYGFDFFQEIKQSRPNSTRVRGALAEIAIQRWWQEAPVWGHGIVERGPKIVEHMPIGTHHSWYGLLFTKGIVGVIALAIPLGISLFYLFIESRFSKQALSAFCLILIISLYSFFENLEILAYLYWPALLLIGYALNPVNTRKNLSRYEA